MPRRRTFRRRFRRGIRRARVSKSIASTTAFRTRVSGNPRPTLSPDSAWHKRVVSVSATSTANTAINLQYENVYLALTSILTWRPWIKIRWIKVFAVNPAFAPVEASFLLSVLTTDKTTADLVIQDYGTGTSLASVGMKIPYHCQEIYKGTTPQVDTTQFMRISATTGAQSYVVHIGLSFKA